MPTPIQVQKFLKGAEYPATKDELIELAEENDAPEDVLEALEDLEQESFDGPDDVAEALGGDPED